MNINQKYIFSNANTLEKFDQLQTLNFQPKLAVSTNGRLVIYSQKPTKTIDKVIQFVKSIFYRIGLAVGFFKVNEEVINQQQQTVHDFLLQKAEKVKEGITDELDALNSEIMQLTTEQSELSSQISSSKEEIIQTTQSLETCKEELSRLNEVSEKLRHAQKKLENSEKKVQAMRDLEESLSQQVETEKRNVSSIKEEYKTLDKMKKQVDALKTEYKHWGSKVQSVKTQSQIDYKSRAELAEAKVYELEGKITDMENYFAVKWH